MHLGSNKLANVRRYIIKSNCLTDAEKDSIKEQVITDIQQNESIVLKMNEINNETDNTIQLNKDCMKLQHQKMNTAN